MKNKVILLLLLPIVAFSQSKPDRYFDENLASITQAEYDQEPENCCYLRLDYDLDTAIYHVKALRCRKGQIPAETLAELKKDLETSSNTKIPAKHIIVINYYPGPDPCNSGGVKEPYALKASYRIYQKRLHRIAPLSQFYVYSKNEGLERYKRVCTWYPDLNDRIMQTFFPLHYPCGSFVAICPDGTYRSYGGEYSLDKVYNAVRKLAEKDTTE